MGTKKVSVTMPNDTVYVNGVVNGAEYVFTLAGSTDTGTVWAADVARASPDIYICKITAINSAGSSTTIETTLYYGLQLITDRTAKDVRYAAELSEKGLESMTESELEEYLKGMKGAYNCGDLNRVESAVEYVQNRLKNVGVILDLPLKKSWAIGEIMSAKDGQRYLENIREIRRSIAVTPEVPEVTATMDHLTYEDANDLEKILLVADDAITRITKGWHYSGDLYAGEV